ncbi:hypothetical protein MBENS4_1807 [Novosphingobium sp. MBES04]|nr:hypothetical protein MBENS4_1807 [Novosphingobium sp. MBES04]
MSLVYSSLQKLFDRRGYVELEPYLQSGSLGYADVTNLFRCGDDDFCQPNAVADGL